MANTSTIKSLDELTIKAISAIRKSQKYSDETRIYDSIKMFLENCDIDDSLFWESTSRRAKLFVTNRQKMEILFIF